MSSTFTLSIEPIEGRAYQHGYHLGTIESVARKCAEDIYWSKRKSGGVRTVALMRDRKIFDVFDGEWSSDRWFTDE